MSSTYLVLAIAFVGVSIIVLAVMVSRAIRAIPPMVIEQREVHNETRVVSHDSPPQMEVQEADGRDRETELERLAIQQMAFDGPPLKTVGGSIDEEEGIEDIQRLADGIGRRSQDNG